MGAFDDIIAACKAIEKKKRHDYSQKGNRWSNFEYAARVASPFKDPVDRVFATLVGVKLARLAELKSSGKDAQNEPLDDTYIDGTNYFALWGAWSRDRRAHSRRLLGRPKTKRTPQRHPSTKRILIRRAPK